MSDALSRYPSLKTYAFTLSLISPTSLGVLGRISFVARDDVEYQRLLTKVLEKTNSAGSTGHVARTLPSSDEPTLEKGAKSTALAQPRMLQPELDPGYHMDTRMRPCPEGDPSADLVYQPRPRSAVPLDHRDSGTGDHSTQPRTEVNRPIVAARNTRTRTGNEDSRGNRPRTEVDTTNSTPTSRRDDVDDIQVINGPESRSTALDALVVTPKMRYNSIKHFRGYHNIKTTSGEFYLRPLKTSRRQEKQTPLVKS